MDIVIIGTGNTATILGKKIKEAGHTILQVAGRDSRAAGLLAETFQAASTSNWNQLSPHADLYILAVSDRAVKDVVQLLPWTSKPVVHTAASVPLEVLKGVTNQYGVLYPLQSLKKELPILPDIPLLIDANEPSTLQFVKDLAHSITDKVMVANDELRVKTHLAAVMVNNFTNHIYTLVEDYCHKEGLDFRLLLPLISETASRLRDLSPAQSQTGPAVRGDTETLKKHLGLLESYPALKNIYELLTESIQQSR